MAAARAPEISPAGGADAGGDRRAGGRRPPGPAWARLDHARARRLPGRQRHGDARKIPPLRAAGARGVSVADGLSSLLGLDRLIHEPARLVLMALLAPLECADFLFLLRETGMTKGNLSSHLIRLEEGGYLSVEKTY